MSILDCQICCELCYGKKRPKRKANIVCTGQRSLIIWLWLRVMIQMIVMKRQSICVPEDGGVPDDPRMGEIFERARQNETDQTFLNFMKQVENENYANKERTMLKIAAQSEYDRIGRCDFYGAEGKVRTDYDTEIPEGGKMCFGLVCEACDG